MALSGFLTHGQCVADLATTLKLIEADNPMYLNGIVHSITSYTANPSVDGLLQIITLNFYGVSLTATTAYSAYSKNIYLFRCDPLIPLNGLAPFDAVTAASYWMYAMTIIFGIYLVAHNAGAILRFIHGLRR